MNTQRFRVTVVVLGLLLLATSVCLAQVGREYFVAPDGKAQNDGTKGSAWDIASALAGKHTVPAGATLWIRGGTYRCPDRSVGSKGFEVSLAGAEGVPITLAGAPGERATIDGGLHIVPPATWITVRDLEILVSEKNRTTQLKDSFPGEDIGRPWGGLEITSGTGCKYVNLVIHDNDQGVGFWSDAKGGELYGCIIYDNGWNAPDRGHGHAVYAQNKNGTRMIADCIMTGGYGYTIHAYGSAKAFVDNFDIEGNIVYKGGPFLVGGGNPSHNCTVVSNYLFGSTMQVGYYAKENRDCAVIGNIISGANLEMSNYISGQVNNNLIVGGEFHPTDCANLAFEANRAVPAADAAMLRHKAILRPNKYDPNRANLVVFNWDKADSVLVDAAGFLADGDTVQLKDPKDFYGEPVQRSERKDGSFSVHMIGDFAAFVVMKAK